MQALQAYLQRYQGHHLLHRTHKPHELVLTVLTLLAHGCPLQAIIAAFSLDERTVGRWQAEAGAQCRRVHERLVEAGQVDLGQVQAEELRVKAVGGVPWLGGSHRGQKPTVAGRGGE